jgi:hypothetical protein
MKNQDLIALFGELGGDQSDFSNPYSTKGIVDSFSNTPIYTGQVLSPLDTKPTPYEIGQEKRRFERQGRVGSVYDDFMRTFGPSTYEARKELEFKKEDEAAKDMTVEDLQKQRLQQQLEKNKQMGGGSVNRPDLSTEVVQEQLDITPTTDLKELRKEEDELKDEIGTTGGDTEDNTNWFDRLNQKVDLMAMGAAMLAGSSSGKGTAANIGQALQVGIASRNKEQLQEEAKKRADAQLAIQLLAAQNKGGLYSNYGSKVQGLSSELQGAGVDGEKSELDSLARLIYGVDPRIINAPEAARNKVFKYMAKELGDDWFGDGGEISIDEAREGYKEAIKQLNAGNL